MSAEAMACRCSIVKIQRFKRAENNNSLLGPKRLLFLPWGFLLEGIPEYIYFFLLSMMDKSKRMWKVRGAEAQ